MVRIRGLGVRVDNLGFISQDLVDQSLGFRILVS
jgi:hypothetical protein